MNLNFIIDVLSLILYKAFCDQILFPILILAFLAVVPCIIRYFCFRK